jgi:imidazole glycerol phosphate synthase subunit HisF
MRIDMRKKKPLLANVTGGYSGAAVFPVALRMVYQVAGAVKIPVVGMGGVSTAEDVIEMMMAGATAVEIGAENLRNPWACRDIIEALPAAMDKYGITAIIETLGSDGALCRFKGESIRISGRKVKAVDATGGAKSCAWDYLAVLDRLETIRAAEGGDVSNGLRAAVLMTVLLRQDTREGASRRAMQAMQDALKMPKSVYFTAVLLMESRVRLSKSPSKARTRFIYNKDFLDALDYNRIVLRAEGKDESILNEWADLYEQKGNEQ